MRRGVTALLVFVIEAGSRLSAAPVMGPEGLADQADKRQLVGDFLQLSTAEASGFWPLYERLQSEWRALQSDREEHLRNYGRDYAAMTDALALEYTKELLQHEERRIRLMRQYLPSFQKVLPARKVARYYQIEEKIHAAVSAETAVEIPLIQ
ncbi:hypothetical protein EWI61_01815 [Methylolobus aquaticus]|nr:hypothetical protein EWI61_01815 [Methylolobus aquaticus]